MKALFRPELSLQMPSWMVLMPVLQEPGLSRNGLLL